MKFFEVSRSINAEPATVWRYLTDPDALVGADAGIEKIDGTFGLGQKFVLKAKVSPRKFTIKVVELKPDERMVWESGMPLGLFKGVPTFTLASTESGTEFKMREEFTGLMLPLIWKSMPDLQPSFEQFANALKQVSENAAA